jgi:hypothetical protein
LAAAPHSKREIHTAGCVAALDLSTRQLAEQVRAGHNEARPVLLGPLKSGAAFVVASYLAGDRDEGRSRAVLDSALAAKKELPESEIVRSQAMCTDEGARLFAGANPREREEVSRVAAKRMTRLLSE